jgi:hypothetical protein
MSKKQVIYIATSKTFAQQNKFKVGGVTSLNKLEKKLSSYNEKIFKNNDIFYFAEWFLVNNFKKIKNKLKNLIGNLKQKKNYIIHYKKLQFILKSLTLNLNYDQIEFICNLNFQNLIPLIPEIKYLKKLEYFNVGYNNIIIYGNTNDEILKKLEKYISLNKEIIFKFKNLSDNNNVDLDILISNFERNLFIDL